MNTVRYCAPLITYAAGDKRAGWYIDFFPVMPTFGPFPTEQVARKLAANGLVVAPPAMRLEN